MKIKLLNTEVRVSIFVFAVPVVLLITGYLKEYAVAFFSITLHELGHMAVSRYHGFKPYDIRITPVGFSMSIDDRSCSGRVCIGIYAAGPATNLLMSGSAAAVLMIFPGVKPYLSLFALTNLLLALFNMIPVYPLDGGRILLEILAGGMGLIAAGRVIRRFALAAAVLLVLVGCYQLYIAAFNFSLLLTGMYIVFLLITGGTESAFMNIRQIIYRRSRLMKKGVYPARDIVVIKETLLGDTLKNMDFDRFHFIYVLDDDLHLARIFTETEIIDAIAENGDNISFGRLLEADAGKTGEKGAGNPDGNVDI